MHSWGYRLSAVATFSLTVLGVMCGMVSFSDNFNRTNPSADVRVLNINWFQRHPDGNDEYLQCPSECSSGYLFSIRFRGAVGTMLICAVSLTMNITANLQSLFTWNTKQVFVFLAAEYETPMNSLNQVSLWDGIIPTKEHARFWIHTANKYRFIDQGSNLRGKDFNLTLHWHVMPKTGKMFADKIVMPGYSLLEDYR